MRRLVCFLLVLALCVSLSCTVFAAVISPGQDGSAPTIPDKDDSNVPETGDNASLSAWLLVMVLALVVLVGLIVWYCKFMKK